MYKDWYKLFFKLYWKSLFMVLWPFLILPIPLIWVSSTTRCLYVLLLMAGYWVTQCIPLAVTGLFPVVWFPLLGILDCSEVSKAYFSSANVIFVAGYIMVVSLESSGLSVRVALNWILLVGTSHRKLHLGLSLITMGISMFMVNTAVTAMMIPIVDACLQELERNDLGPMYTYPPNYEQLTEEEKADAKIPTRSTINFFLTAAYCSTHGGCGTLVGTDTNLAFKGLYEEAFPKDEITFAKFGAFNIVPMFFNTILCWFWLEIYFLGLFRPKSEISQLVQKAKDNESTTRETIRQKVLSLGKMSFQEIMILILFIIMVLLFIFSDLSFIPGWYDIFPNKRNIKDSVTISFIVIMYFVIPAQMLFLHCWDKDVENRPKKPAPALLTWRVVHERVRWGMVFLLGGGFALEMGMSRSGLSDAIGEHLATVARKVTPLTGQIIFVISTGLITELTSNVAVCNILTPIAIEVSKKMLWHPIQLVMPVGICCSYAFMLPVATPPNALVAGHANLPTSQMIIAGFVVKIISIVNLLVFWQLFGISIFNGRHTPEWLEKE
ncbi:protein I'm not dead yet-like [Agrilus planipennis]|uniref:Protein I'm not dead yet-like n=1 Tax=Agrilus planipennis TaxID=224129 RepID=A0A1W4WKQ2_AGRPL|nr:protein I'm not dead yet-like [Agrilus planipennis]